jgi:hypothetical protein
MGVDAVLIIEIRIVEVVGEPADGGEFPSGLRIEIGVSGAAVDRPMPEAEIDDARRIVSTDRQVEHAVDHGVVKAVVPAQRRLHEHVAEACHGVAHASLGGEADRPQRAGDVGVDIGLLASIDREHVDRELSAEHR